MKKLTEFTRWQNQVLALVSAVLLFSCSHLEPFQMESDDALRTQSLPGTPSIDISNGGITPYIIAGANQGGNTTCAEVSTAYKLNSFQESFGEVKYENGNFESSFPAGFTINVDGKRISWSFTPPPGKCLDAIAFIVKGGNAANTYVYGADIYSDSGLTSPDNPGDDVAGLSNLTICYTLRDCEEEPPCEGSGESATGDGRNYEGNNNWFQHSAFNGPEPVNFVYGRNLTKIGTVSFSPGSSYSKILVTVTLDDNAIFDEESGGDFKYRLFTSENLKVGDVRGFRGWTKVSNDDPKEISFEVDKKIGKDKVLRIGLHAEVTVFDCENDNGE